MPKTKKIVKKNSRASSVKKVAVKRPSKKVSKKQVKRKVQTKTDSLLLKRLIVAVIIIIVLVIIGILIHNHSNSNNNTSINTFKAQPYDVVRPLAKPDLSPNALISPSLVKNSYKLSSSSTAGAGKTIAIIDAYDDPTAAADLATFSAQYGLPSCTTTNGCFSKYQMSPNLPANSNWAIEDSLDLEWAHAIAPGAKLLLIESKSDNGTDLINALNYVKTLPNIASVSLSWGGNEFNTESQYENYFINNYGAVYFAASGDSGAGTSWPAVSANVIGVGGTTLNLSGTGTFLSETAWNGSGGGISRYIREPARQTAAKIPFTSGYRASPDVAYNANPNTGYAVYDSTPYAGYKGWFQVGGTSAGTPQWAAIAALSNGTLNANKLYTDANTPNQTYLRDITVGNNGFCGILCTARVGYDYVTGYGSPLTYNF